MSQRVLRRRMLRGGAAFLAACFVPACKSDAKADTKSAAKPRAAAPTSSAVQARPASPVKVERKESAMGTALHFVAYTTERVDRAQTELAIDAAIAEIRRLEEILSEWRDDSEVGRINVQAGQWVPVGRETLEVIEKSLLTGRLSEGTFDITFQAMSGVWRFGSAQAATPTLPTPAEVRKLRALIDYRKVELDTKGSRVRIPKGRKIGLGGIAKGYIVDRAVEVMRRTGLNAFLVQAGGDLYGAGRKPDGSAWVSGIQDPRGPQGEFFATLELENHAFSTAGDYARFFVLAGKRYHHIIDPRSGYPATASRSVTVHAPDAITADMIDDAVFILGPEKGLKLASSLPDVGVVIVDASNKVWVSPSLEGKVRLLKQPSDGV
ncbi:MAG: FAD:protein FMN transferase [Myxococcota bacterium]